MTCCWQWTFGIQFCLRDSYLALQRFAEKIGQEGVARLPRAVRVVVDGYACLQEGFRCLEGLFVDLDAVQRSPRVPRQGELPRAKVAVAAVDRHLGDL